MKLGPVSPANQEPSPTDWLLSPVPDDDIRNLDWLDDRGVWNSVETRQVLRRIMPQPGSTMTIVARKAPDRPIYVGLFEAIADSVRDDGRIRDAAQPQASLAASFEGVPTVDLFKEFLQRNSREAGHMTGFSQDGVVPYAILDGNAPRSVEFGLLDSNVATRTSASRQI